MEQPAGFVKPGKEHLVCKLKKAIYGLKHESCVWYQRMHAVLQEFGFIQSCAHPCVYVLNRGAEQVMCYSSCICTISFLLSFSFITNDS